MGLPQASRNRKRKDGAVRQKEYGEGSALPRLPGSTALESCGGEGLRERANSESSLDDSGLCLPDFYVWAEINIRVWDRQGCAVMQSAFVSSF
jgi:hypothetical protein